MFELTKVSSLSSSKVVSTDEEIPSKGIYEI